MWSVKSENFSRTKEVLPIYLNFSTKIEKISGAKTCRCAVLITFVAQLFRLDSDQIYRHLTGFTKVLPNFFHPPKISVAINVDILPEHIFFLSCGEISSYIIFILADAVYKKGV